MHTSISATLQGNFLFQCSVLLFFVNPDEMHWLSIVHQWIIHSYSLQIKTEFPVSMPFGVNSFHTGTHQWYAPFLNQPFPIILLYEILSQCTVIFFLPFLLLIVNDSFFLLNVKSTKNNICILFNYVCQCLHFPTFCKTGFNKTKLIS